MGMSWRGGRGAQNERLALASDCSVGESATGFNYNSSNEPPLDLPTKQPILIEAWVFQPPISYMDLV